MDNLSIVIVDSSNQDLIQLISKLDNELLAKYPAEDVFGVDFNEEKINHIVFVVAYLDDITLGCGAFSPLDAHSVELKRIFVDTPFRNKGIASKILLHLENEAKNSGYKTIRLETGTLQPEAIALYKKYGYYDIERFDEYVDCQYSICMEKKLI